MRRSAVSARRALERCAAVRHAQVRMTPWARGRTSEQRFAREQFRTPSYRTGGPAHSAPVGRHPAADRARAGATPHRDRHGRQRKVGRGARAAAHGRARARRGQPARLRARCDRARRRRDLGVRLLHRELEALARRGALPHGLQPRRDPSSSRRDERPRRAGAVGGPASQALEVGDRRARGGRAAHRRQLDADPHDVRQLRRPRRDRRRRARDRAARWRPGDSTRARSTSAPSPATSTSPTCPTSTCSCARRGSSARATS